MDLQSQASDIDTSSGCSMMCQSCQRNSKSTTAVIFCETCNIYLCSECSRMHKMFTFDTKHIFVPADTATMNAAYVDLRDIDRCSKHNKCLEFFCEDEDMLCCGSCAILEHRKCEHIIELNAAAANNKEETLINIPHLQQIYDTTKSTMHYLESTERNLSKQMEDLSKTLDCMQKQLNEWFDKFRLIANQIANDETNKKVSLLQQRHVNCESLHESLSQTSKLYTATQQHGTAVQQFIFQHKLKGQMQDYQKTALELLSTIETLKITPKFADPISNLLNSGKEIAFLEMNPVAIDKIPDYRLVELELISSLQVKQSDNDVELPLYTGMDYLADGRLIVADNLNKKLLMMNENLETIFALTIAQHPMSVVTISEDSFAVSSAGGCTVNIYCGNNSSVTPQILLQKTIETKSKFGSISNKDDNHFVVSTIDNPVPALILSKNGEESIFSFTFPCKQYKFDSSSSTYMKRSEKLILCDRYHHTIHIFDSANSAGIVVKDDKIQEPRGLASGPNETIFVCSSQTHSIVQISSNGQILSSHKLDMLLPYTVCVSKDMTKLAVANSGCSARILHIYKIIPKLYSL